MPNPFGITEVDVPGALGAYEAGQTSRVNRLLHMQQLQTAQQDADRRLQFDTELMKAHSRQQSSGGAAGAYPAPVQQLGTQMSNLGAGIGGVPVTAPPPVAEQPQSFEIPPDVLRRLTVLDPERAGQIVTALNSMDTAQRTRLQAANLYMANAAQHLRGVPMAQRAAEIQRITPDLLAHGITQQQLQSFTPDDNSLDYVVQSAMDVERLGQVANPHPVAVTQGGSIVDTNRRPDPETGVIAPIYESPTVEVQGMPYTRPPQMRTPTVTAPVRELPPGFVVQQPGSSSAVAPDWPIAGGAASVPRGFQ